MCRFILSLSLLFFFLNGIYAVENERSKRGDSLSKSSSYEEPTPIGNVKRKKLQYDAVRNMYYQESSFLQNGGWDDYEAAKKTTSKRKKLERLSDLYDDEDIDKKCKGWVAHDIGDIYVKKYISHKKCGRECEKKYEYRKYAVRFYKRALRYGDKDCRKTTKEDIENYGLSKYME